MYSQILVTAASEKTNQISRQSFMVCILMAVSLFVYIFWSASVSIIHGDGQQTFTYLDSPAVQRRQTLRIAQIAPLVESVPPKMYGGTERIVSYLVEELVRRGHQVTLFASNDSQTSAKLVSKWPSIHHHPVPDPAIPYTWMLGQLREKAAEFDVLHFHTDVHFKEVYDIFKANKSALVMTMHGLLSWYPGGLYSQLPFISISNDQRTHGNPMNFIGTVYHGLPRDLYKFVESPSAEHPYLAFLGRIDPTKLPDWAIQIAVKSKMRLKIAARADPNEYWLKKIKPMIEKHKDLVEFMGELNDSQKNDFLGNAKALIFPINWPEPFGMVMIEAMACGTPVIARRSGSVPEIVDEGISGLLFYTIGEAVEAVKNIGQIERKGVRRAFEKRFTVEKMANAYEEIYQKIIH